MLNRIIIAGFVILFQLHAVGQSFVAVKQADKYFQSGAYYNAIINYEIYLGLREAPVMYAPYSNNKKKKLLEFEDISPNKPQALKVFYNLAQSYRMLNDYASADKWYKQVILFRSPKYPLARLWHGVCLRARGDYNAAERDLKRFIKDNESDVENVAIANNELNNINFIRQQVETRKPPEFALNKLKGNINQTEGAYAPFIYKDTLIFTSSRIVDTVNKFSKTNSHVNHLFYNAINHDTVVDKSTMIKFPSLTATNEGTPTFSPSGNKIYFTRWESGNAQINASIYVSNRNSDGSWSEPTKLDEKINKSGYNSNQPFITDDDSYLLYASDRPDGVGKYDIWASKIEADGSFGEPFNLKAINTKEDDKAPFYHTKTKSLVFSSNGRVGMGGYDLFSSNGDLNSLQTPVNMGYPINSVRDDNYYFTSSKDSLYKNAFVSSDRASSCCLEVFAVKILPKKVFKQKIDGLLSDCKTGKPIDKGVVVINNEIDSTKSQKIVVGSDGLFLVNLSDSISGITVKKKGYNPRSQSFRYDPELYMDTTYLIEICMDKGKKVYYKQKLNALVIDCETKKPIQKAYVSVLNAIDSNRSYVVSTSQAGAFSINLNDSINGIWFEKKAYFDKDVHFNAMSESLDGDTVYTVTYCMDKWVPESPNTPQKPVVTITDPGIVKHVAATINKSDSVTIYFDFNKTDVKPEGAETLNNLLAILKTYPTISLTLDISGHTDSKGSEEVNMKIGRARAIACLDYLIERGISESRLRLKSYGKSAPAAPETVNNKDNPNGRAKNRRVVMKVKATVVATDVKDAK